ncbi:MAG: DUF1684 domain-containing protein [Halobacteriales archaeon]
MNEDWKKTLRRQRDAKDEYFAEDPRSPVPDEVREDFPGLDYYPVDETYRYETELHEHDDPERVTVATSTEGERTYLRWGEFRIEVAGREVTLQAYKSDPDDDRLWVPFRDQTSGDETYGAGRYIDLESQVHENEDGTWTLDFNEAYNPTCAYSDAYDCPLPPADNWLDVAVEAGERKPPWK